MKSGKSAMELYKEACAAKCDNESSLDKEVRVLLLGKARRGNHASATGRRTI